MLHNKAVLTVLVVLGTLLLASAAVPAVGFDREPVDDVLQNALQETHARFDSVGEDDHRIQHTLDHGAYRWSLTYLGGSVSKHEAQQLWEEARHESDPYAAFGEMLLAWNQDNFQGLQQVAPRLSEKEGSDVRRGEFEQLLFAAQYAVLAESAIIQADNELNAAQTTPERFYNNSVARETMAYRLGQATVFLQAANSILDHFEPDPDGPLFHTEALDHFIEENGGAGSGWRVHEQGHAHKTARHLLILEPNLLQKALDEDDPKAALDHLQDEQIIPLREHGFSAARAKAASLDASWWFQYGQHADANDEQSPTHADMTQRMKLAIELARYESHLLLSTIPMDERDLEGQDTGASAWFGGPSGVWIFAGVGFLVILCATGLITMRRKGGNNRPSGGSASLRERPKGRGGAGGRTLSLLIVVLLAASGVPLLDHAETRPSASEPFPEPLAISEGEGISWGASVLVASDGVIHFVWGECLDPPDGGCDDGRTVVKHRTHDPASGSWSDPIRLVDHEAQDAYMPVAVETAAGIMVVWIQGIPIETRSEPPSEHPAEVWTCLIVDDECADPQRVSRAAAGVESAAAAVGPDGRLRIAWSEARDREGHVVFRQQSPDGWQEPLELEDGGIDQRQPALTVDDNGKTHLVWLAKIPEAALDPIYRVVYYTTIDPDTNTAQESTYVSQHVVLNQGADVAIHGDELHLIYAMERGLYHTALHDGEWTPAYNVGRTEQNVQRPNLVTTQNGVVAVWLEPIHPHPGLRLMMAELHDGIWLRPNMVLEPPHRALHNPYMDIDPSQRIHLVWAGNAPPDEPTGRAHYMTLAMNATQTAEAPEIDNVTPAEDSWNRSDPVELEANLELDAPLDHNRTQWKINGDPIPYTVASGSLTASLPSLPEGIHDLELVVMDQMGNQVEKSWSFGVDRTRPEFTASVVDENDDPAEGWTPGPLRVTGEVIPDDGAPARLEVEAVLVGEGSAVKLDPAQSGSWAPLPDDGVDLPEGLLLEVTVRARDEAGNFAIGDTITAGWDATPPTLEFEVPQWTTTSTLQIPVTSGDQTTGSPIQVHANLTPLDSATGPIPLEATVQPGSTGSLDFGEIEDGRYTLNVTRITDKVGNHQEPLPGPWNLGVDTRAPTLEIREDNEVFKIEAIDDTSGIDALRILKADQVIADANPDPGATSASVTLDRTELTQAVRIIATDVASNEIRKTLHPDGRLEEYADPDEGMDPDTGLDIGTQEIEDTDPGRESGTETEEGRRLPGPGVVGILLILAFAGRLLSNTRERR